MATPSTVVPEDNDGNTVDAIVEFFWFQSSIDRGADLCCRYQSALKPSYDDSCGLLTGMIGD